LKEPYDRREEGGERRMRRKGQMKMRNWGRTGLLLLLLLLLTTTTTTTITTTTTTTTTTTAAAAATVRFKCLLYYHCFKEG